MSCTVQEVSSYEKWDEFVARQEHAQFLQSSAWKAFQESLGRPCKIVACIEDEKIRAGGLFVSLSLPMRYRYLYIPRGPIGDGEDMNTVLAHILSIKDSRTVFARAEPPTLGTYIHTSWKKVRAYQPEYTLILDLSCSEEALLEAMHPKTRYNVRLSEKKEVRVIRVQSGDATAHEYIGSFIKLLRSTAARDAFYIHTEEHYRALFKLIPSYLYCALIGEEVIAANLVVYFGDTVTYLHGASSDQYRNVMAPYLLQWEAIKDAKKEGRRYYDFWGIAPVGKKNHPWAGITRFKKGFGGSVFQFRGTLEIPLNTFLYQVYTTTKFLLKRLS